MSEKANVKVKENFKVLRLLFHCVARKKIQWLSIYSPKETK